MSMTDQIRGLERNLERLRARRDKMVGPAYCPPNACCPSCVWGAALTEVEAAIDRREHLIKVWRCRLLGLKPQKIKTFMRRGRSCQACGGSGRTTKFSVGACRCGEPNCPGRGRCHSCGGTGNVLEAIQVVIRPWPKEIS